MKEPHEILDDAAKAFAAFGLSAVSATEAFMRVGEAMGKVPFPTGKQLRAVLMHAWERDHGLARFFFPRYWKHRFFGL